MRTHSLLSSARITTSIGMLIAGAMVFNYVITIENIPKALAATLKAWELSQFTFLLLVNILLLVLGCVLEGTTILSGLRPGLAAVRASRSASTRCISASWSSSMS